MSKLQQIKEILFSSEEVKEVTLAEMKLDDGVTVIEAEMFEAGNAVNVKTEDGQLIPMPVGEFILEDGMILVVSEEGVIAEIKEATAEEPQEEEQVAADSTPEQAPTPKAVVESVIKETKFSAEAQAKIDELEAKIAELSKVEEVEEVVELKEETPTKIVHNPEAEVAHKTKVLFSQGRSGNSTKDRVRAKLNNILNK